MWRWCCRGGWCDCVNMLPHMCVWCWGGEFRGPASLLQPPPPRTHTRTALYCPCVRYDFLLHSPVLAGQMRHETEFDWGGTRIFVSTATVEGLRCFFIEPKNGFFATPTVYGRYDDEVRGRLCACVCVFVGEPHPRSTATTTRCVVQAASLPSPTPPAPHSSRCLSLHAHTTNMLLTMHAACHITHTYNATHRCALTSSARQHSSSSSRPAASQTSCTATTGEAVTRRDARRRDAARTQLHAAGRVRRRALPVLCVSPQPQPTHQPQTTNSPTGALPTWRGPSGRTTSPMACGSQRYGGVVCVSTCCACPARCLQSRTL